MNTKEAVWREALRQFSARGYHGVTMKEIAAKVGINDSSIYNHYKSKEEIFHTIIEECSAWITECCEGILGKFTGAGTDAGFLVPVTSLCQELLDFFLENETAAQFRRMLIIEKNSSEEAWEALHKIFLDDILSGTETYFQNLMDRGYFKKMDSSLLALQFYAPAALLFLQTGDWGIDEKESMRKKLIQHIEEFDRLYRAEQPVAQ